MFWMPSYCPRRSKDAFTLSDVREPTLTIACDPCGRRGRYAFPGSWVATPALPEIRGDSRDPPESPAEPKTRGFFHPNRRCLDCRSVRVDESAIRKAVRGFWRKTLFRRLERRAHFGVRRPAGGAFADSPISCF